MVNLDHVFTYHPPRDNEQRAKYEELRAAAKDFAATIQRLTPECADQTCAVRHVRDALMTANAALALDGRL